VKTTEPTTLEPIAVSVPEAGRLLGVSRPTVWRLVMSGELPSFWIGEGRRLVRVCDLHAWIADAVERERRKDGS
jgi:excisionase family DNA binding protein